MLEKDSIPVNRPNQKNDFEKSQELDDDGKVAEKKNRPDREGKFDELLGDDELTPRAEKKKNLFDIAGEKPTAGKGEEGNQVLFVQSEETVGAMPEVAAVRFTSASGGDSSISITDIKPLADHISEKFVQVKSGDTTNTSITIRHPPAFAGATVRLTEHASAQGEYNVTFASLSDPAKALLDVTVNQDALRMAMDVKGIPLHIITTKTEMDNFRTETSDTGASRDRGDQKEEQGERQEKR